MSDDTNSPIISAYREKTPGSAERYRRSVGIFPSGITHDSRYLSPHPIFVDRAAAARKWDVDGNEYVDYQGGHGALMLGHNHPAVVEAVQRQILLGTHYGACHDLEMRWGELVQAMIPSAERVRFTSSGTEATMMALRLARAFTGRRKLLRFRGHFHGWHDHMAFGVTNHFDGTPTPGVLPQITDEVVLVDPNDEAGVTAALDQHPDIAAVIIEPTGSTFGQVPIDPVFLKALRRLTAAKGVVLIFDEVVSGFRASPGGAQAALGVTPDMSCLAKILSGGLPGGAVVGRKEILDNLDFEVATRNGGEKIPHPGTFNANPLSAAAGIAALEIIRSTDACARANAFAERMRLAINALITEEGLPWACYGTFSGVHIFVNPEGRDISPASFDPLRLHYTALKIKRGSTLVGKLRLAMRVHGVDMSGWPGCPASAVHDDADFDQTMTALRKSIRMLKDEGEIGGGRKAA